MTKGILTTEQDTKARKALIGILRRRGQVFGYERSFVDHVTGIVHRNFTVAEANRIHQLRGRMGSNHGL